MHRVKTPVFLLAMGAGVLAGLLAVALWLGLRGSLPALEGTQSLPGLSAAVSIERDADGVPVIRGATRLDVARASGWVHAQERFFQMDLTRRSAAGELAALVGPAALDADRAVRIHRFRHLANTVYAALAPDAQALLTAYAEGVNAGLAALTLRPFEYYLLRQDPVAWQPADTLLASYAMWLTLQRNALPVELQHERLHAALPEGLYRLVARSESAWDAPLDDTVLPDVPLPRAAEVNLRNSDPALFDYADVPSNPMRVTWLPPADAEGMLGSNNWALAGTHTASGRGMLANDMHLGFSMPNTWYRARLIAADSGLDITGVMLPGAPLIVAGSNGHIAWGFTNAYGDFQDLVLLEFAPGSATHYLTPDGPEPIGRLTEIIEVAGAEAEPLPIAQTRWGPIIGTDAEGRTLVHAWTAHRAEALNLELWRLEAAQDLDTGVATAARAGMPAQNALIAAADGRIAWVVTGRFPDRGDYDPLLPASWAEPGSGWNGWVDSTQQPRVVDPASGRAWSANSRVIGGDPYRIIGDGGYAHGARGRQIRDRLATLEAAEPTDFLGIHLDDRAIYLARWQGLLLSALQRMQPANDAAVAVVRDWYARAAAEDPGYRLVRTFERIVTDRSFAMLTAAARARWPTFRWRVPARFTDVAWRLISERPPHLLDPRFSSWDAWLDSAAEAALAELADACEALRECTWGEVSSAPIRHPLSQVVPGLSWLADLPRTPLPGDWSMPRVQSVTFGASERFAVEPGREEAGYFHMPGGQSGHPLAPYYGAGHEAWINGEPTPFLPGPARYQLTLTP